MPLGEVHREVRSLERAPMQAWIDIAQLEPLGDRGPAPREQQRNAPFRYGVKVRQGNPRFEGIFRAPEVLSSAPGRCVSRALSWPFAALCRELEIYSAHLRPF